MTSASSLAFPGSRTLALWWRQLASFAPQTLCVGYLFVHRLEAPACWLLAQPLDPLLVLVLEALVLDGGTADSSPDFYERLHHRLRLDVPILRRLLRSLADTQMVEATSSAWNITEQGRQALQTKSVWTRQWKRAVFPFIEQLDPTGQRLTTPHFAALLDAPSSSWHVEDGMAFDMAWLQSCLQQPPDWKMTFQFPADVITFPAPGSNSWEHVALDRSERLLVVLCEGPSPGHELLGFSVRPEGWALNTAEPILRLPGGARAIVRELERPASLDLWKPAWQSWCKTRTVPPAMIDDCALAKVDERLRIEASADLLEYLRAGKSDVFKGETWLLAGDGYLREAARLDVVGR